MSGCRSLKSSDLIIVIIYFNNFNLIVFHSHDKSDRLQDSPVWTAFDGAYRASLHLALLSAPWPGCCLLPISILFPSPGTSHPLPFPKGQPACPA